MDTTQGAVGGAAGNVERVGTDVDQNVRDVAWTLLAYKHQKPAELALRLGISRSAIYSRFAGKTAFTVGEVADMAEHFGIAPGAFLAGTNALLRAASSDTKAP